MSDSKRTKRATTKRATTKRAMTQPVTTQPVTTQPVACVASMGIVADIVSTRKMSRVVNIVDAYGRSRVLTMVYHPHHRYVYQIRIGYPNKNMQLTAYDNRETITQPVSDVVFDLFNHRDADAVNAIVDTFVSLGIPAEHIG